MVDVASLDFSGRLGEVFQRTLPKLAPNVRDQLAVMIEPESLAIIGGVLTAWIVGHAFGVGEVIDIVIAVVGVASIGLVIFTGLDELYEFAKDTYSPKNDGSLTAAAEHLAKAIAILGVDTVLAVLFKGRPKGGRFKALGPEPPRTPGWHYRPSIDMDASLPNGVKGRTDPWGNIQITIWATDVERELALSHEKVHSFLAAKFYLLRRFRLENRFGSYFNSSFYRFFEEALAQSIALVGKYGFEKVFQGIGFPFKNRYVYLIKGGGYKPAMKGSGFVPELTSLIGTGMVQGFAYELWFASGETPP
jgi:hypothetical protein